MTLRLGTLGTQALLVAAAIFSLLAVVALRSKTSGN